MRALLLVTLIALTAGPGCASAETPALQARYLDALIPLVDQLVSTQITNPDDPDYGALVSPSNNPQPNPRHSRAAEAVYPLAVAWKHTQDEAYRTAAIRLGNWLVDIQQDNGAWGENWPGHDGWDGTTADQLISLAGALELLQAIENQGGAPDREGRDQCDSAPRHHVVDGKLRAIVAKIDGYGLLLRR